MTTTLASSSHCRRCSECIGQEHHFLEHCEHPSNGDAAEFYGFICKHCEVKADICDECEGPVFPITGAAVCAECTAERGDFD